MQSKNGLYPDIVSELTLYFIFNFNFKISRVKTDDKRQAQVMNTDNFILIK